MLDFFVVLISMLVGIVIGGLTFRKKKMTSFEKKYGNSRSASLTSLSEKTTFFSSQTHDIYGLTQLLNDQQDEAIDTFLESLQVAPVALDLHLALGRLLRKQGELDRAVKVHQNLLAHPHFTSEQTRQIRYELAKDYLHSGLFDRAQLLLADLTANTQVKKDELHRILKDLLSVEERLGHWKNALDVADRLTADKFSNSPDHWRVQQAYYCCEIVYSLASTEKEAARNWIRRALKYDPNNLRALLMRSTMLVEEGRVEEAFSVLAGKIALDDLAAPQVVSVLSSLIQNTPLDKTLHAILIDAYSVKPSAIYLLELICLPQLTLEELKQNVTILEAHISKEEFGPLFGTVFASISDESLLAVKGVLPKVKAELYKYYCVNCGIEYFSHQWQCSGCRHWASVELELVDGLSIAPSKIVIS